MGSFEVLIFGSDYSCDVLGLLSFDNCSRCLSMLLPSGAVGGMYLSSTRDAGFPGVVKVGAL